MTIARRLAVLETRRTREDAHAMAERIAAAYGIPVARLLAEAERVAVRCAAIGMDAYLEEQAAAEGITVAALRAEIAAIARETATP
jgi:hypothetical protein